MEDENYKDLKFKVITSGIITLAILVFAMTPLLPPGIANYAQMILTLPVMIWAGSRFYKGFWNSLKHKTADMNTLVAVGTGAAFIFSTLATVAPYLFESAGRQPDVYFDTAAVIITLILLGRMFEARAKGHTSDAVRKLADQCLE